ncbi:hypothetical protein UFOVP384_53 [uncultured Caudovirales phage]|uniref:Uncharacterized protein n=1 Tax=uncultured Caudovirales phage TaxID=2100421 RepID=A0A6J7X591_9CAUD|nr:hypothetical protein UFOVP384_53 [uncultured Caudovirales phage]
MATQRTQIYLEGVALDLDKNVDIDFTYSIADISDFEKRTTTFSKTIVLPGTAHNSFLLGNYFDFNINNEYTNTLDNVGVNYNPLKKAFAKVTLDNVEVFVGVLRLLEITSKNGELQYQCALFGSLGGLFTALGDRLLTDLDLSDLDHTYDITTITNSWETTDLVGDGFVYPSANYGIGVNASETQYDVRNFRPAVSVKRLFDEIISQAGYTYQGDFWDNNNLDKLILQNGEEKFSAFYDELASASFVERTTNGIVQINAIASNGLTINTTTDKFINNTGSTINLKLTYNIYGTNSMAIFLSCYLTTTIYDAATNYKSGASDFLSYGAGTTIEENIVFTRNIVLEDGESVQWYFSYRDILGGDLGEGYTLKNTSTVTANAISSTSKVPAIYNTTILGASIVPEGIKQSDFIKSIINLLNLYIIQDPNNEFDLTFIPYNEFYTNEIIDWTDKKDLAKGFSVKGSNEFIPKSYSFKYKDDADFYCKTYKNRYTANYGDLKYETQNQFSKDDTPIELPFSLAPIVNTGNSTRLMAQLYDINTDGTYKQVKCNPKLSFWGGIKAGGTTYSIKNGDTVLASGLYAYGYAGHIYNPAVTSSGLLWDLCFAAPREIYFNIGSYPTLNLYHFYYKQFIDSQNNKDTKLITLYLLLNAIDIMNLSFRKYVRMDNGIYYLNKIDGYNPLGNELTKVELLRLVALEELDVYVEYTPVPIEDYLSYVRVTIDKILPFDKSFDVQYQFTDGSEAYTNGTETITIYAGNLYGNGFSVVPAGNDITFTFIRILEPASDEGYIYIYGGDYNTF